MKKTILFYVFIVLGTAAYAQTSAKNGYIWIGGSLFCEDGVLFCGDSSRFSKDNTLIKYPQNKQSTSYTIPDWVYIIANGAFKGNKYIKTIRIPYSVDCIGEDAFDGCDQLTSIEIYKPTSAVRTVETDESSTEAREVGRYNIQGVKIQEDEEGQVQIILYSDGTSKKIINN